MLEKVTKAACSLPPSGWVQRHLRTPRLAWELRVLHGEGTFGKWLVQLAKTDVLILGDWAVAARDTNMRADLLEVIDDRAASRRHDHHQPVAGGALA